MRGSNFIRISLDSKIERVMCTIQKAKLEALQATKEPKEEREDIVSPP